MNAFPSLDSTYLDTPLYERCNKFVGGIFIGDEHMDMRHGTDERRRYHTDPAGVSHHDGLLRLLDHCPKRLNADYGPSAMDIRHSLNFVGVYDLPFGHGRTYGSNANRFVDAVLGGWRFATSAILYSGFPVTIFGPDNSNTNNNG